MNLPLQMNRNIAVPLQDQLFEQLRQLILTGKLKPNYRIIATRFLAEQLGVSRTTVLLAYEQLISEGYLVTRPAVGTFVCSRPPQPPSAPRVSNSFSEVLHQAIKGPAAPNGALAHNGAKPIERDLAQNGVDAPNGVHVITEIARASRHANVIDFCPSRFDASHLLSSKVWLQGLRNVLTRDPLGLARSQPASGVLELRQAIADNLAATRGIMASPEQVIIVCGQRQACSLIAHLFQGRGDRVVIEAPSDESVVSFFEARRAELVRIPVDEFGLETERLPQGPVSLAYVTPALQHPFGGILPPTRRDALLDWARESGAYIIEDSGNSDFRYQGTTPQALAALDPHGRVFYTSSFARTLGLGLGLGYLVVPPEFVDAIVGIKSYSDEGGPWLEQMALAELIVSGRYEHHLRRVRRIYMERRDALILALQSHFGELRLVGTEGGTQLTWILPDRLPSAQQVSNVARCHGVHVKAVSCSGGVVAPEWRFSNRALIFGYGNMSAKQLRAGIARLAEALSC